MGKEITFEQFICAALVGYKDELSYDDIKTLLRELKKHMPNYIIIDGDYELIKKYVKYDENSKKILYFNDGFGLDKEIQPEKFKPLISIRNYFKNIVNDEDLINFMEKERDASDLLNHKSN